MSAVLLRKTLRDMLGHKIALLSLAAIASVGVGAYVGMASLFEDMDGTRRRYYADRRLMDFSVDVKRAPAWAVERVAAMPNVRAARGRVHLAVRLDLPGLAEPISGTAISMPAERAPVLNDVLLRSGAWFSGADGREVILLDAFARAHGLAPGSRLRALLLDKEHDLLVVGTAMSPEFVYLIPPSGGFAPDPARFGVLYLPERFLQRSCDLDGAWNQIVGLVHDDSPAALDRALRRVEEELDAFGVTNTTPARDQPSVRFLHDELQGLRVGARVVPAIFLGVAALVLNILMERLVRQQRTVIGTLRALGYSRGAVLRHYLGFGLALGLLGAAGGAAFGLWVQRAMVGLYREFFALPDVAARLRPEKVAMGIAIGLAFALGGAMKGVRHAAAMQPAEAMRPPPPERGGRVLPERIGPLWRRLSLRRRMVLRAIFRNPFRSAVGVAASFVSASIVFGLLAQMAALEYLMDYEFSRIAHQDLTISVREPSDPRAAGEVSGLPGVAEVEGQLSVVCDVSNGPRRRRVAVTGLARGHRLHTPLDAAGRPIVVPEEGIVLSRKLAELLGVGPGDTLRLRPLIGRRQEAAAAVAGTVDSFIGLTAYADVGYLARRLGEERPVNVLLAVRTPGAPLGPLYGALRERPTVVGAGERTRAQRQMDETFGEVMWTAMGVYVLLAGLIAFGSVANMALVSLSERQREVGTLRVLGFTPRQVAGIFAAESALVNGVGVGLGLLGGIAFAHLMARIYDTELYRFPVVIRPWLFGATVALMAGFVASAQWIVGRLVRRVRPLAVISVRD